MVLTILDGQLCRLCVGGSCVSATPNFGVEEDREMTDVVDSHDIIPYIPKYPQGIHVGQRLNFPCESVLACEIPENANCLVFSTFISNGHLVQSLRTNTLLSKFHKSRSKVKLDFNSLICRLGSFRVVYLHACLHLYPSTSYCPIVSTKHLNFSLTCSSPTLYSSSLRLLLFFLNCTGLGVVAPEVTRRAFL